MTKDIYYTKSRRETPWTEKQNADELQSFLDATAAEVFENKHKSISNSSEVELFNTYQPSTCPYCGSTNYIQYGKKPNGLKKYRCETCERYFGLLTGTIFQGHKVALSEWIEFVLAIFRHQSFSSISFSNRNAYTTTKYWISKIFMLLENYQDNILLAGEIYIDETFYKARKADIQKRPDGNEYRGISTNQLCIGIGYDGKHTIAFYEGKGKTSKVKTKACYASHITPGSTLIHDLEKAHTILTDDPYLKLENKAYNAKLLKKVDDKHNPLDPINKQCFLLKHFLNSHSGFIRDDIQDYLNLFSFISNEAQNPYLGVEKLLRMAIHNRKTLSFREKYASHASI